MAGLAAKLPASATGSALSKNSRGSNSVPVTRPRIGTGKIGVRGEGSREFAPPRRDVARRRCPRHQRRADDEDIGDAQHLVEEAQILATPPPGPRFSPYRS